jgi:hypothetical protein
MERRDTPARTTTEDAIQHLEKLYRELAESAADLDMTPQEVEIRGLAVLRAETDNLGRKRKSETLNAQSFDINHIEQDAVPYEVIIELKNFALDRGLDAFERRKILSELIRRVEARNATVESPSTSPRISLEHPPAISPRVSPLSPNYLLSDDF